MSWKLDSSTTATASGVTAPSWQQRRADVAAQKDLAARGLHHLGDEGGGGGLAVRTGHGDDLAGAERKEKFHLAGDHRPGPQGRLQFGLIVFVPRCAHDDVLPGKTVGIMFPQAEVHPQAAQGVGVIAKFLQALFLVAERHPGPHFHKLFNTALVADARADKGHLFAADKFPQLFYGQQRHCASLPCCVEVLSSLLYSGSAPAATKQARLGGPVRGCFYSWPPMGMPCFSSRARILVMGSMMLETLLSWLMAAIKYAVYLETSTSKYHSRSSSSGLR